MPPLSFRRDCDRLVGTDTGQPQQRRPKRLRMGGDRLAEPLPVGDGRVERVEVPGNERAERAATELAQSVDLVGQADQVGFGGVEARLDRLIAGVGQLGPGEGPGLVGHRADDAGRPERQDRRHDEPDGG